MTTLQRLIRLVLNSPLVWFLLLMLVVVGGSYFIFGLGAGGDRRSQDSNAQIIATANILAEGQPVLPFAAIDPAVTTRLLNENLLTNPQGFKFSPADIPPIGEYLPGREEGFEFELRPNPALHPLDNQLLDSFADLPITSESVGDVELLEYAGDGCSPAGLPVSGVLTQRYHSYHSGIDIGVPLGMPVVTTHSGTVLFAGWSAYGYGYLVIIQNGSFVTYYAHLTNFNVKSGDKVGAGSVVAWSGSTGNSTGPHVHYETRIDDVPVDPLTFEQRGYASC